MNPSPSSDPRPRYCDRFDGALVYARGWSVVLEFPGLGPDGRLDGTHQDSLGVEARRVS